MVRPYRAASRLSSAITLASMQDVNAGIIAFDFEVAIVGPAASLRHRLYGPGRDLNAHKLVQEFN